MELGRVERVRIYYVRKESIFNKIRTKNQKCVCIYIININKYIYKINIINIKFNIYILCDAVNFIKYKT